MVIDQPIRTAAPATDSTVAFPDLLFDTRDEVRTVAASADLITDRSPVGVIPVPVHPTPRMVTVDKYRDPLGPVVTLDQDSLTAATGAEGRFLLHATNPLIERL